MTTLEAKPIAFFFRPFSPLLGTPTPVAGASVLGTAALSIRAPLLFRCAKRQRSSWTLRSSASRHKGRIPKFCNPGLYILYMSDVFA